MRLLFCLATLCSLAVAQQPPPQSIGKIFVVGRVKKPGVYPLYAGQPATVFTAIAAAEGVLSFHAKTAAIYNTTTHAETRVPLEKILRRKAPDIPLHPGDILFIPDSKSPRLTAPPSVSPYPPLPKDWWGATTPAA